MSDSMEYYSTNNSAHSSKSSSEENQLNNSCSPRKPMPEEPEFSDVNAKFRDLEERRKSLSEQMEQMRKQILEEKLLWRKEIDVILDYTKSHECVCHSSKSSLSTSVGYQEIESLPTNTNLDPISKSTNSEKPNWNRENLDIHEEPTRDKPKFENLNGENGGVILEYERKINKYQKILASSQAESKCTLRKQLVANAFKRRLQEVENMCTVELMRVQQNITSLQPLQTILGNDWLHRDFSKKSLNFSTDLKEPFAAASKTSIISDYNPTNSFNFEDDLGKDTFSAKIIPSEE